MDLMRRAWSPLWYSKLFCSRVCGAGDANHRASNQFRCQFQSVGGIKSCSYINHRLIDVKMRIEQFRFQWQLMAEKWARSGTEQHVRVANIKRLYMKKAEGITIKALYEMSIHCPCFMCYWSTESPEPRRHNFDTPLLVGIMAVLAGMWFVLHHKAHGMPLILGSFFEITGRFTSPVRKGEYLYPEMMLEWVGYRHY